MPRIASNARRTAAGAAIDWRPAELQQVVATLLPTRWGTFRALGFERRASVGGTRIETAVALTMGDLKGDPPLLRIHSQCFTGEALGSLRCDCAGQLEMALRTIAEAQRGLLIYEHKEGRGIGLMAKLQAYALQDSGLDTVDANRALGFSADCRNFNLPIAILHHLGIDRVRLLSNNPRKQLALDRAGIEVVGRVPCEIPPTAHSLSYLETKRRRMGHALTLAPAGDGGDPAPAPDPGAGTDVVAGDAPSSFATIETALNELRAGRMIVVVDDEDRENEGDLTMAAEMVTPEAVNFMATHGRGLICVALSQERLATLDLAPMVTDNSALGGTAFTVSIDVTGPDITTGISAHDRARTLRAAADPGTQADDFARPGHVFPLRARDGGVLERRGQTEAAVDLTRLAGLRPAGVICEIVNDDGTMARVPDLIRFCAKHGLVMVTVADLARHRFEQEYLEDLIPLPGPGAAGHQLTSLPAPFTESCDQDTADPWAV